MKKLFLLFALSLPLTAYSQEMRFKIEEECTTQGSSLIFKCNKEQIEFTIIKNGKRFTGVNSATGTTYDLKVLEADSYITVLQNPVAFNGISTIHLTSADNRFYWVEVAYSTILKNREMTVRSGRRLK